MPVYWMKFLESVEMVIATHGFWSGTKNSSILKLCGLEPVDEFDFLPKRRHSAKEIVGFCSGERCDSVDQTFRLLFLRVHSVCVCF